MNSLGIITINYNRPKVLELWCSQIRRLRNELGIFFPAVVVSEMSDVSICNPYFVHHISYENKPVTNKFNRAFKYMQSLDVDSVMILGSDDIISTELMKNTLTEVDKGIDLIGVNTLYFYCGQGTNKGKMVKLERPYMSPFLGVAKTVSKKVLDQCDWTLWNTEKNWGMDAIASKTIAKYAETRAQVEGMVVDVKTTINLNSFRVFGERKPVVPAEEFYKILSEEELKLLHAL